MIEPPTEEPELPELPPAEWEATKETLHPWAQIVGKVRMSSSAGWDVADLTSSLCPDMVLVAVRGTTCVDLRGVAGLERA